jgi:S-adenosylmethionine/arginine decarboxylase-like enzyme
VVLHVQPESGSILIDVLTPGPTPASRAVEVIARRLGVAAPAG